MCGIFYINKYGLDRPKLLNLVLEANKQLLHRGIDSSGSLIISDSVGIGHTRLAIMDTSSGTQPLTSDDNNIVLSVNGEIYNYLDLKLEFPDYNFKTNSDSEIIIPLYMKHGVSFINKLSGMFSFVLFDKQMDKVLVVRDHMGITPLYYGKSLDKTFAVASEMKALVGICNDVYVFPPGYYYYNNMFTKWYSPPWLIENSIPTGELCLTNLKNLFENAVKKRMMSDVPFGVFLSGGLDSSLVASIAARNSVNKISTFSIGLENSLDLQSAKVVADFLDTKHYSFTYTTEEGINELENIIRYLETYDVTTIRSSIPMYILSKKIREMGFRMVLSGEGSDEMFGGYLYFSKAPSKEEFHFETVDKLLLLHKYDCLRANKSTMAAMIETRVPFLDKDLLNYVMSIDPLHKMINKEHNFMEKYIIRKAFDIKDDKYLPDNILWRRKEQFSDGVSSEKENWIDSLKEFSESKISDEMLYSASDIYKINTPLTKEAMLYRQIFSKYYKTDSMAETIHQCRTIACSTERAISWDKSFIDNTDPSGKFLKDTIDKK
jgi:asparagine synthase (glutamine-hydrolysing)